MADGVEASSLLHPGRGLIWTALLAEADAAGQTEWEVSVDAMIDRAHQHATNTTRTVLDTGVPGESRESQR